MNKNWMATVTVALLLTLLVPNAPLSAQDAPQEDPTTAKFNKEWEALDPEMRNALGNLMTASGSKKMVDQIFQTMAGQLDRVIEQKERELGKSDPRIRELVVRHTGRMGEMLVENFDELIRPMMIAYSRHYTLEEVQELIAFYESPVGQKMLRTLPRLMADGMEGMMPLMVKHMDNLNRDLKKEMDKLMEEIAAEGGNESRYTDLEAEAVSSMRLTIVCAITYLTEHPDKGFPSKMTDMGPDGDNCLDRKHASGTVGGYRFEYQPTDIVGEVIMNFAIIAIPIDYGDLSKQSFFAESSGIIRFTTENRAATENDPPL